MTDSRADQATDLTLFAPEATGVAPADLPRTLPDDGLILWDRQEPDFSHCTPEAAAFFTSYFAAKRDGRVDDLIAHYHEDIRLEDIMPRRIARREEMRAAWKEFYPLMPPNVGVTLIRVLGDMNSAIFDYSNDPMVYRGTCHVMSLIVFKDGKIIRHTDYTDGRHFGFSTAYFFRKMGEDVGKEMPLPTDMASHAALTRASPLIRKVAAQVGAALAEGRAQDAAALFDEDGVFNDWVLETSIRGQAAIARHFAEYGAILPYGAGSRVQSDVLGNDLGGGYRWRAAPALEAALPWGGGAALELTEGRILRMDTQWDSLNTPISQIAEMRPRGVPRTI